jgi:hypothetical protein
MLVQTSSLSAIPAAIVLLAKIKEKNKKHEPLNRHQKNGVKKKIE